MTDDLLDVNQVAKWLGYSVDRVRVKARQGEIPATKPLGRWRFDPVKVVAWLEANATEDTWAPPPLARIRKKAS